MASTLKSYTNFGRYKAQRLHHIVEDRYLRGNLISKPLWYDVVRAFPPIQAPRLLTHQSPTRMTSLLTSSSASHLNTAANEQDRHLAEQYCGAMYTHKWEKSHRNMQARRAGATEKWTRHVDEARKVQAFPSEIKFVEDELREKFRAKHPLEVMRPIRMKDQFQATGVKSEGVSVQQALDSMFGRASASKPTVESISKDQVVDIESAVRYQTQLMERENLSEDAAFEQASQVFYANRTLQEQQERERLLEAERRRRAEILKQQQQAEETTGVPAANQEEEQEEENKEVFRPATEAWLEQEQQALRRQSA